MSFSLFNENTSRYGVILQETSELRVEQQTSHHSFHGERVRCTIRFIIDEKRADLGLTPVNSLARAILSHTIGCNRESEVHDAEGRIWIVQGCSTEVRQERQTRILLGAIELMAPGPCIIDESLLESVKKPIDFKLGKVTIDKPKEPRTNLLRPNGEWKCT